jgi:hypothetical protein
MISTKFQIIPNDQNSKPKTNPFRYPLPNPPPLRGEGWGGGDVGLFVTFVLIQTR